MELEQGGENHSRPPNHTTIMGHAAQRRLPQSDTPADSPNQEAAQALFFASFVTFSFGGEGDFFFFFLRGAASATGS
eukprot:424624-Prorocentrum_minimum.AAC.1